MDRNSIIITKIHNSKYQCMVAASCTYQLPNITSQLLNKSYRKKIPTTKYW